MGNNYQRLFYILKNMDSDVGYPTGYIKVEINNEQAKIQLSVNNLLDRQGLTYQLYGIKKVNDIVSYSVICEVPYVNGRADIKVSVDINSIGSNSIRLEDINIFAIITQVPSRATLIKCPLVAYTKGELSWKKELENSFLEQNATSNENAKYPANSEKSVENDYVESLPKKVVPAADITDEIELFKDIYDEAEMPEAVIENQSEMPEAVLENQSEVQEGVQEKNVEMVDAEQENKYEMLETMQDVENPEYQNQSNQGFDNEQDMPNMLDSNTSIPDVERKGGIESKFESVLTSIYNVDKSTTLDQERMAELIQADNDILSFAQENFNDISSIDIDAENRKIELNMPSLKDELDKNFESCNPFKMKSKSIRWWKINSPGFLNNILFRNNVKSYLLFNPKVMLAHYKYRYIIFGVRHDKHSSKEYLICGVPGVYSIDENPFGSMASWAQLEGYRPKYGAFGYWVILIDPRTGKLLKIK